MIKRREISKQVVLETNETVYVSKWFYLFLAILIIAFVMPEFLHKDKDKTRKQSILKQKILSKQLLNQVSEASLVSNLAQDADLPVVIDTIIASEIEMAKKTTADFVIEETSVRAVPIFDLTNVSREIKAHKVKDGETIDVLTDKYNINKNTIKWANDLKTDNLTVGANLRILPLDGIIYRVKKDDDLDKITAKYKGNSQRIITFNDLEVSGIKEGQEIIIPEGVLPKTERPDYVAPAPVAQVFYAYTMGYGGGGRDNVSRISHNLSQTAGNKYVPGNCTWYSYERRKQMGKAIPAVTWGNANAWASSARRAGYRVDRTPEAGAIFQTTAGYYGHVGIVEAVLPNGDINVTEMNYAGLYVVSRATINKDSVGNYLYIH